MAYPGPAMGGGIGRTTEPVRRLEIFKTVRSQLPTASDLWSCLVTMVRSGFSLATLLGL
jgi:hypothetical protein